MSFGAQIFVNGTSFDVIDSMTPTYLMELFTPYGTGSKTYSIPTGKTLRAQFVYNALWQSTYRITTSGNTVSWVVSAAGGPPVFVYAE